MLNAVARFTSRFVTLAFGGSCFLCGGSSRDAADPAQVLCAACEHSLMPPPAGRCPVCALRTPGGETCGRCIAKPPAFDATVCLSDYDFPADVLVQALKFRGELSLAGLFGRMIRSRIEPEALAGPDCVVPVPISDSRMRERGFNQSMEIARAIVSAGGPPVDGALAVRTRETAPQAGLPWKERARNLRGAFHCDPRAQGLRVAVVDDVMTTGSTLDELAATLKSAGARSVVNWVVARTPAAGAF